MVCFPAFAMLKQSLPNVEITRPCAKLTLLQLAELCPSIDKIIIDASIKKILWHFKRITSGQKRAI